MKLESEKKDLVAKYLHANGTPCNRIATNEASTIVLYQPENIMNFPETQTPVDYQACRSNISIRKVFLSSCGDVIFSREVDWGRFSFFGDRASRRSSKDGCWTMLQAAQNYPSEREPTIF